MKISIRDYIAFIALDVFLVIFSPSSAWTQVCSSIGGANPSTITQNFDNLGASPAPRNDQTTKLTDLSALLPNNPPASRFLGRFDNTFNDAGGVVNVPWAIVEEGPASSTVSGRYNVGDGSSPAANTYSFASTGVPADRALGSLTNTSADRNLLGSCFTNTSGAALPVVYIGYTGEQWRNGGSNIPDRLRFQYAVEAGPTASNIFTANGGVFTDFNTLDFVSRITSTTAAGLDGNLAANRRVFIPRAVPAAIPSGGKLYIRWIDVRTGTGTNDDALAIDDFLISLMPPTAAGVSINGRLFRAKDGPWFSSLRTSVVLTDTGGNTRTARVDPFGFYNFADVPAGQTYVLSVTSKRSQFSPRVVAVDDKISDLNLTAEQ
ncbi:MAG: hypothetical protein ABI878_11090 [Acidobacteriota bacterium]